MEKLPAEQRSMRHDYFKSGTPVQRTSDTIDTSSGTSRSWYLVLTKPLNEEVAKINLERQGYKVYLPRLQQKLLRRGKWRDCVTALFPRYVFVQLESLVQSLAPVRSTIGVANVVRFGVDYAVVPNAVVDGLVAQEDPATKLHSLRDGAWFKPGDAVRIATGSLSGLEGVFQYEDGADRVVVLLSILGREAQVRVDAGSVVASAA